MRAMIFDAPGQPLRSVTVPDPVPAEDEVLVKIGACGLCRTDLHVVDGELTHPKVPLIPGHQVVGEVVDAGAAVETLRAGDRVGIPWLGWTCGVCAFCTTGRENLCDKARFTGYDIDGGYAEYTVADSRFCFPIDRSFSDIEAAPLLCAGLIGYRSLIMAGDGLRLGLYGFGASAHIVAQVAKFQGRRVFAVTRPGDVATQKFALHLGMAWAGGTDEALPEELDAAIIFAPVGALVPLALGAVRKGGTVVCAGIHMSDIRRSRTTCSGASARSGPSPTSLVETEQNFSPSHNRFQCMPRWRRSHSTRRTSLWPGCAPGTCRERSS